MTEPTKASGIFNNMPAIIITLIVIDSLHFVFARLLIPHLPPTASSFYYMTIATIQIGLYAAVRRKIDVSVLRDNLKFFLTFVNVLKKIKHLAKKSGLLVPL